MDKGLFAARACEGCVATVEVHAYARKILPISVGFFLSRDRRGGNAVQCRWTVQLGVPLASGTSDWELHSSIKAILMRLLQALSVAARFVFVAQRQMRVPLIGTR
jgi:hypothetical protein